MITESPTRSPRKTPSRHTRRDCPGIGRLRTRGQAGDASGASGAASSRNALRVVQAVVLAGQLTVVLDNSICLVDSPSAQLTGVVPGQDLTHHATVTKVTPVTNLRLAQLG